MFKHTQMSKYHRRKCVSNDELEDTGENQEHSAKENQNSAISGQQTNKKGLGNGMVLRECSTTSCRAPPRHQAARQGCGRQHKCSQSTIIKFVSTQHSVSWNYGGSHVQRSRITQILCERCLTVHHRVQVEPLKLLCGQGHRGWNLRQSRHSAIFELLSLGLEEVVLGIRLINCHVADVGSKLSR